MEDSDQPKTDNVFDESEDQIDEETNNNKDVEEKTPGLITQIFGDSEDEFDQEELSFPSQFTDEVSIKKRKRSRKTTKTSQTVAEHDPSKHYEIDLIDGKKVKKRSIKNDKNVEELSNKAKILVDAMFEAARVDRENYENGVIAMKKIQMLPNLRCLLHRSNLYPFYVENRIHLAIAEWLQILSDGKLPNVQIRSVILSILESWPTPSKENLIDSGLGRALKNLTKHPQENSKNREKATKLIYKWGNQIFSEKEVHREVIRKSISDVEQKNKSSLNKSNSISLISEKSTSLILPGDKNFKIRAVQPPPSSTEYKIRPLSSNEKDSTPTNVKKQIKNMELASRLMRRLKNRR